LLFISEETSGLCEECINLRNQPDSLSNRKHLFGVPFKDVKQVDEDGRIKQITTWLAVNPGKTIGVMVDYGPQHQGKADRYIEKVKALLPEAKVVKRFIGPTPGIETLGFSL